MVGSRSLCLHFRFKTSSAKPRNIIQQMDSRAARYSMYCEHTEQGTQSTENTHEVLNVLWTHIARYSTHWTHTRRYWVFHEHTQQGTQHTVNTQGIECTVNTHSKVLNTLWTHNMVTKNTVNTHTRLRYWMYCENTQQGTQPYNTQKYLNSLNRTTSRNIGKLEVLSS